MAGAASLALLMLAMTAPPRDQTAEQFVRAIYASYDGTTEDGALGPHEDRFFSRGMLALIKQDEAANTAAGGGVGVLDGDPVCDCQDDSGIRLRTLEVTQQDAVHAIANAELGYSDGNRRVVMKLTREPRGWRINDVKDNDEPWLRKLLADEIVSLHPHHRH